RFPLWLAPVQAVLLPVNDSLIPKAEEYMNFLKQNNIRALTDDRSESIKRKIRDAQVSQIPLILTIGEKEVENTTFAVRTLTGNVKMGVAQNDFIDKVKKHIDSKNLSLEIF
ncbi:MAG: His/Gly/Thr/Pro-type tRNA ligase C-terminal domain-containing protein, partial [Thermodesulfobacteriota bacterium]